MRSTNTGETMISREQFKKYLDILRELEKKQDEFDSMFEIFDPESSVCTFIYSKPINAIIKLLKLCMDLGEDDDNIDYYIWEINWGKRGKDCIELPDGVKVSLRDDDELYNFLIECAEERRKNDSEETTLF